MDKLDIIVSQFRKDLQGMIKTLANHVKTHEQVVMEKWVRKEKVMKMMGISSRTFQRLTSSGQLPYSKINGIVFISVSDIDELLNKNYNNG